MPAGAAGRAVHRPGLEPLVRALSRAGVLSYIFLMIIGLREYALALAVLVAVLDIIPLIGATLAGSGWWRSTGVLTTPVDCAGTVAVVVGDPIPGSNSRHRPTRRDATRTAPPAGYSGRYRGFGSNSLESVPLGSTRRLPRMRSTGIVSSGA